MTALRKDITIEQGTDFTDSFSLAESLGNLTGAVAAMQIRKTAGDVALATLTTWEGTLVLDAGTRSLTPLINEDISASLPPGKCVYDVKMQVVNGTTYRPYEGSAFIEAAVTTIPMPAPTPPPYAPSLDFSNSKNSQYIGGGFF